MSIGGIVISDALRYKKNIINPICVGLEIKKMCLTIVYQLTEVHMIIL